MTIRRILVYVLIFHFVMSPAAFGEVRPSRTYAEMAHHRFFFNAGHVAKLARLAILDPVTTYGALHSGNDATLYYYFGNACALIATGTWQTPANWNACGGTFPSAGDTATIDSHTVTVNQAQSVGASGATNTIAITHHSGGTLTIANGGSIDMFGDLDLTASTTNINGTLTIDSPAGSQYKVISRFAAGNSIAVNCGDGTYGHGVVTTAGVGTHGYVDLGQTTNIGASENHQACEAINLGDTTNHIGWKKAGCTHQNGAGAGSCLNTIVNGFLAIGSAGIKWNYQGSTDGKELLTVNAVTVVSSIEPTLGNTVFELGDDTALVAPGVRTLQNTVIYNNSANDQRWKLDVQNLTVGISSGNTCTTPGFRWYNTDGAMINGSKNVDMSCFMELTDQNLNTAGITTTSNANTNYHNGIIFQMADNQHPFQSGATLALARDFYQHIWLDGSSFTSSDSSDFVFDNGTHTIQNNIDTNKGGTIFDELSNTGVGTVLNNTLHNSFGAIPGEAAGGASANALAVFRNNLFDQPAPEKCFGLGVGGSNFVRQAAAAGWLNNNGFYRIPGSGDSGATTGCLNQPPLNLQHPGLGTVSYVAYPLLSIAGVTSTAAAGTNANRFVTAAGNWTGAQAGDFARITTNGHGGQNNYGNITAVTVANPADVNTSTITTMQSGDSVQANSSYFATAGVKYGDVGYGNLDIHADPLFSNPNASACSFFTSIGGIAHCAALGNRTATAGTNTTTINCTACTFQTWGIAAGDKVAVWVGATYRGSSTVATTPSETQITVSPAIAGMTSGDVFGFSTHIQGLAREMVKLNGFDYLGNPTAPNAAVSEAAVLAYGRGAYTSHQIAYKGTGSVLDGSPDIGAEPVVLSSHRRSQVIGDALPLQLPLHGISGDRIVSTAREAWNLFVVPRRKGLRLNPYAQAA